MKLLNLEDFRNTPDNTLFFKALYNCSELEVKTATLEVDFLTTRVSGDWEMIGCDPGDECTLEFNSVGRDGCFEDEMVFAVYELKDLLEMKELIESCIAAAKTAEIIKNC